MIVREYFSYKESKDVFDRLMSKTYQEYKDNTQPEENHLEPEDDGLSDIEDSKQQIVYGEEEE